MLLTQFGHFLDFTVLDFCKLQSYSNEEICRKEG